MIHRVSESSRVTLTIKQLRTLIKEASEGDYGDFEIEDGVLKKYTGNLERVAISNDVTEIAPKAFQGCTTMSSLYIPESVTSIGGFAFSGCSGLMTLKVPGNVRTIGACAFSKCHFLSYVSLGWGVKNIAEGAFRHCSNIRSIFIPSSVRYIGPGIFDGCSSLKTIIVTSLKQKEQILNGAGKGFHATVTVRQPK